MSISQHVEGKEETSDADSDVMGGKPQETMPEFVDKKKRKRRPPLVPWKKPKDMPRRPLSAYNIFFKEQREAMMAQVAATEKAATEATHQHLQGDPDNKNNVPEISKARARKRSNKSVGIGFANLARTIAANWKDMSDEARAPYEASAASEKARYKEEMLVWRAKQKRDKEKALLLSSCGSGADVKSLSHYPQGILDSSGETSMDESHTGTVTSAPHSYSMPLACSTQGSRQGNTIGGSMDVDSPKRTRLTYQQHCDVMGYSGKVDPDTAPIHLSDMPLPWAYDPRAYSYPTGMDHGNNMSLRNRQSHPLHASLSRLDALQATSHTMGANGHALQSFLNHAGAGTHFNPNSSESTGAMPHHFEPYPFSHPSSNNPNQILQDEKRLIMQEHHMLQHQHLMHQAEGHHYRNQHEGMVFRNDRNSRRNSWSGTLGASRYQSKMLSDSSTATDTVRMLRSSVSPVNPNSSHISRGPTNIPDSWFEPETSTSNYLQSSSPRNEPNSTHRGSKLYPDTWFEVGEGSVHASSHDRDQDDEPMRYSPEGDLTGKLPPPSLGSFTKDMLVAAGPLKQQGGHQVDGKMEDQFQPPARSSGDGITGGSTCSISAPSSRVASAKKGEDVATKPNYSPEAIIESSSLQALGMQFDEETMDFLARLRYESTQSNPATAGSTD